MRLEGCRGPVDFGAKIRFGLFVVLLSGGWLLTDARPAYAYIDPILPGLIYQIGYFVVYGMLGVLAFFKPIKRLFKKRHKGSDPPESNA